jgi:hypothetical protein
MFLRMWDDVHVGLDVDVHVWVATYVDVGEEIRMYPCAGVDVGMRMMHTYVGVERMRMWMRVWKSWMYAYVDVHVEIRMYA